ncbi:MAG: hypothetical protein ACLTEX_09550 [Eggerthella lenta]
MFRAEVLKGLRAPGKVALIAPLLFCALACCPRDPARARPGCRNVFVNFWYVLMMPVAIALIALGGEPSAEAAFGAGLRPARTWWRWLRARSAPLR